jgi:hypothetical protein
MTLAHSKSGLGRVQVVPKPPQDTVWPERDSDVWPDWSTDLSASELAKLVAKNKPSIVLLQASGAIIYSVGLVILLMLVFGEIHLR